MKEKFELSNPDKIKQFELDIMPEGEEKDKLVKEFWDKKAQEFNVKRDSIEPGVKGVFLAEKLIHIAADDPIAIGDSDINAPVEIKSIVSENFKKLNITIPIEGRDMLLRAENGAGKSSVIDAIYTTLYGLQGYDIANPIQIGQDEAKNTIQLTLNIEHTLPNGDTLPAGTVLNVIRKFVPGGTTLNITIEGLKKPKNITPNELLKFIIGEVMIPDPSDLWKMKTIDMKKWLTKLSGIAEPLEIIQAEHKDIYDRKHQVEQELFRLEKDLEEFADVDDNAKDPDFTEIQEAITKKAEAQKEITAAEDELRLKQQEHLELEKEANEISFSIQSTNEKSNEIRLEIERLNKLLITNQELVIVKQDQLDNHKKTITLHENVLIASKDKCIKSQEFYDSLPDRTSELDNLKEKQKEYLQLQQKIAKRNQISQEKANQHRIMEEVKDIEDRRKELFKSARMPIPGLSIDDEGVYYKGVPLTKDQISESEGLELCMDILIAEKPKLRLVCFKQGHAFSTNTLKRIFSKAKWRDYQIVIEKVADNKELEIEFLEYE